MSDMNTACPRCGDRRITRLAIADGVAWICDNCGHQRVDSGVATPAMAPADGGTAMRRHEWPWTAGHAPDINREKTPRGH